jgi:Na+-translocating ferredoxin:NAD+ oxidoreductase RnfD subunit
MKAVNSRKGETLTMTIAGIFIGILNCILLVAILVLLGAVVVWVAQLFEWPIPWNIQRLYLLVVLLVFIICIASLLLGTPMVHFIGHVDLIGPVYAGS